MRPQALPDFATWEQTARVSTVGDPLWTVRAFRLAMYALHAHRHDRQHARREFATSHAADQLARALGSVAANIAEGYSRASVAERIRFYGYALGSAREALVWYDIVSGTLGAPVRERETIIIQIRRLLLTTLRRQRPTGGTAILRDPRGDDTAS